MSLVKRMVRGLPAAALLALIVTGSAGAGLRVKQVDLSSYPAVQVTVLTSSLKGAGPTLTENGAVPQGLVAQRLRSKSVALAIDRSASMRGRPLARASAAARKFVAAKPQDDRIALISFGSGVLQLTSFANFTIDVDSGLRTLGVDTRSGTALYDAVVVAARALSKQPRPRLLILLTDGRDVSSKASLSEAIAAARDAGVAVYAIGIVGPQLTPGPLRALAHQTGGSYYAAASSDLLEQAYARLAAELKRTWDLQYFTVARPGDPLRLAIGWHGARTVASAAIPESKGAASLKGSSGFFGTRHWWTALLIGLLVGVVIFFAAKLVVVKPTKVWVRERLEPWRDPEALEVTSVRVERERLAVLAPMFGATERALANLAPWRKLERVLERADVPLRAVELFYLMLACSFLALIVGLVAGFGPFVTILLMVAAGIAPYVYLARKASKRLQAFDAQLPAALNTLAGSLKAGHSFSQAIHTLVEEGGPPIDTEFGRVLTEARLGRPMDAALTEMGRRVGSKELSLVLRATVIQRQVGGSMAGLFELVSDTLTQRQQFRQKVKAVTAQGRMTAMLLIGLPFFIGFLISLASPGYLNPLFHTGTGRALTGLSVLMMVIGTLMLRKIVSFKGYR